MSRRDPADEDVCPTRAPGARGTFTEKRKRARTRAFMRSAFRGGRATISNTRVAGEGEAASSELWLKYDAGVRTEAERTE